MADGERRAAIIDIGSNSVRLVVYSGPARAPQPIFNEKLMAGLGADLSSSGRIGDRAYSRALAGLDRFSRLIAAMGITDVRCVATAAVREAENGPQFVADAAAAGHAIELLSGQDEARAAGFGVLSAMPDADGIVADLGGGSLELVRVRGGETMHHSSFPLGVLRLDALITEHGKGFNAYIAGLLRDARWPGDDRDLPLYLVGGSWRALARYDMMVSNDPMPILFGHNMSAGTPARLHRRLRKLGSSELGQLSGLSSVRIETMPAAAAILAAVADALKSRRLVATTSGLREGLLFQDLPPDVQAQDPFLVAAAAEGSRSQRFAPNGAALDAWLAPLFADDVPAQARLRRGACYLSDLAAVAHPDFRTERAAEMALHGQWLGIGPAERRVLAQALFTSVGGQGRVGAGPSDTDTEMRMTRATQWGLAIRLAQRLSGGAVAILQSTALSRRDGALVLTVPAGHGSLAGEQTLRRLSQLASAVALKGQVETAK